MLEVEVEQVVLESIKILVILILQVHLMVILEEQQLQ
jgi:hypothetical protein